MDPKLRQERFGTVDPMGPGPNSAVIGDADPRFNIVKYFNTKAAGSECPAELAEEQPIAYCPGDHFKDLWEEKTRESPRRYQLTALLVERRSPDGEIEHPITPWGEAEMILGHTVYDQHGRLTALFAKPSPATVERAVDQAIHRINLLSQDEQILAAYQAAIPELDEPVSSDKEIEDRVPAFAGPRVIFSFHPRNPHDILVVIV